MIERKEINNSLWMNQDDKQNHFHVICDFIEYLNRNTKEFILKDGTSLMVCYGLDRFSEDIDLDINGVKVYKINDLFGMKMNAYNGRDKIRDLYDVVFIVKNFENNISSERMDMFKDVLTYKGMEQFDYLIKNQADELIDNEKLATDFLEVFDKLGLLDDYRSEDELA